MNTSTPNAALNVSAFITSALIGSTTDPVIANRISRVVIASSPSATGMCDARLAFWSTKLALCPVTPLAKGACSARMRCTRRWLAPERARDAGTASIRQRPGPTGCGGLTARTPRTR